MNHQELEISRLLNYIFKAMDDRVDTGFTLGIVTEALQAIDNENAERSARMAKVVKEANSRTAKDRFAKRMSRSQISAELDEQSSPDFIRDAEQS